MYLHAGNYVCVRGGPLASLASTTKRFLRLDPASLVSLFDNLPVSLAAILQEAFEAVEVLTAFNAKQIERQELFMPLQGSKVQHEQDLDPEGALWDQSVFGASFRIELSPDGQRSRAYASRFFESLYGLPHDVILERLDTGRGHLPFTELEHLGNIIEVRCDVRC